MKILILVALVILVTAPESFAKRQYFTALDTVYPGGSCGTCHVSASGGGPRNSYGILFEGQPNYANDPAAALKAIGAPTKTTTPATTAAVTSTIVPSPIATKELSDENDIEDEKENGEETETMEEKESIEDTAVPAETVTGTPKAPGFGILLSLVGLFTWALMIKRNN